MLLRFLCGGIVRCNGLFDSAATLNESALSRHRVHTLGRQDEASLHLRCRRVDTVWWNAAIPAKRSCATEIAGSVETSLVAAPMTVRAVAEVVTTQARATVGLPAHILVRSVTAIAAPGVVLAFNRATAVHPHAQNREGRKREDSFDAHACGYYYFDGNFHAKTQSPSLDYADTWVVPWLGRQLDTAAGFVCRTTY
jgi:hypothetical protein